MPIAIAIEREELEEIGNDIEGAISEMVGFDYGSGMLNILCSPEEEESVYEQLVRAKIKNVCWM